MKHDRGSNERRLGLLLLGLLTGMASAAFLVDLVRPSIA